MSTKSNPPWKELVENVLAENMKQGNKDSLNFQLATMPLPSAPQRPSVRTVVNRGFAGQPRKPDEPSGGNPIEGVTSDLLICSSDVLMLKSKQIQAQQDAIGATGTKEGGGNGFEVCWWHQGTQEQFRLSGTAWLLTSPDASSRNAGFPASRLVRDHISFAKEGDAEAWTWEGERLRQFAKHSPGLRGTFQNPEPASPLTSQKNDVVSRGVKLPGSIDEAESEEEKKKVAEALERFSLVVLEIEQVDHLKVEPPPVRTQWTLENGAWQEHKVSP